jgi:GTP-binding protein
MFTDSIEIKVRAGRGGDGRLSFRHEKYRPKGGPDGGDGGHGGTISLLADHNLNTLSAFRTNRSVKAQDGEAGGGDRKHGKSGEDIALHVPEGTQVYRDGGLIADLTSSGDELIIAKGGRGGFGNAHFTSSTRQAPRAAELGERGEEKELRLELKLVADVGLVGLPNAGKSTLLSVTSNAKPEIGDYPFTTLTPNLGVVDVGEDSILVADIPGLIEGASQGKGLGDQFLRHIERTAVVLHLIDAYSDDVARDYGTIMQELKYYQVYLSTKHQVVALTKTEGMPPEDLKAKLAAVKKAAGRGSKVLAISVAAHLNIDKLLQALLPVVQEARSQRAKVQAVAAIPVIDEASQPDLWKLTKDGNNFVLSGQKLEGFARRTDWNNDASVDRMRDILHKQGVDKELARLGAEPGALVKIEGHELEWLG